MACLPNKWLPQLIAYSVGVSKAPMPDIDKIKGIKLRIRIHTKMPAIGIPSDTPIEVCEALGYVAQKVCDKISVPDIYPIEAMDELGGREEIIIDLGDRPLEALERFFKYYMLRRI